MDAHTDLERAMRRLPEEFRTVLLLAEVEGLPLEEVARVMACPVGTVKSRIFRAKERLRGLLPRDGAVIGIDLAEDKQALAVVDHDVRVVARKTVRVKAFRLGEALDWAAGQARAKGFAQVTVACEPTGPRWMQVQRLCAERGLVLVCVQPLASHIAREQQDYTAHKRDESDAVLIARLACETGLFPVFEAEAGEVTGVTKIRHRLPVEAYLRPQKRFAHLFEPEERTDVIARIQARADRNIDRFGLV